MEIVIEPEGVDPDKYKRIGEERTRTIEFEPGKLDVYKRQVNMCCLVFGQVMTRNPGCKT